MSRTIFTFLKNKFIFIYLQKTLDKRKKVCYNTIIHCNFKLRITMPGSWRYVKAPRKNTPGVPGLWSDKKKNEAIAVFLATGSVTLTSEQINVPIHTKNKEKPFIISTASINIKVLGTVFNVKAYSEDKQTETSLLHGSIEVTIKSRPNDKIILSPSEKLIVENQITSVVTTGFKRTKENITRTAIPDISTLVSINKLTYNPNDSTVAEAQWINNKLIFRDETFSDLAVQMERWYNVNIEIKNEKVAQQRLNGTLETETITQALDALQETTPFRYEKTGNKVVIN